MSPSTIQQLESELAEIFSNAPSGLAGHTHLALPKKPKEFNAMTHGLSGQNIVLTTEEIPRYARMALDFFSELQPVGAFETSNVQLIFEARWRVHRILSVENDLFVIGRPIPTGLHPESAVKSLTRPVGMDRQVNAFREEARNIEIISRYEGRLLRNASRLFDELQDIQKIRAVKSPALVFDADTHPAIIWYKKVQARHEALVQAQHEYEQYETARQARDAANAAADAAADAARDAAATAEPDALKPVASTAPADTSFRKNPSPRSSQARHTKPTNPRPTAQSTKKAA